MIYIYGLIDPESGLIRYVGKSIRPAQRLQNHMNEKPSNCHRSHWLQSLKAKGLTPELVLIESIEGEWPWQESERYWIAYGRKMGWPLTNNTEGGDGVPGLSGESKARMLATWKGRKHSEASKLKIGAATASRRHSADTKARMSKVHTGRKITWVGAIKAALSKFSPELERLVLTRLNSGERVIDLAKEFGVHRTTISKIKKGKYRDQSSN